MISRHSLFRAAALALFSGVAAVGGRASDARVVKVVGPGEASYTVANGPAKIISGVGEVVPEHAQITTGAGVDLYVEAFPGAVATIRQNSVVTLEQLNATGKRQARLNLKSGEIISTIDPSRKSETDYAIVTPKGVASAKGTVFAVRVIGDSTAVGTLSGIVEIDRGPGVAPLRVPFGQMAVNSEAARSLAALAQSDPSVAADIVAAVQVVATNVSGSLSGAGDSSTAVGELAAVTSAAVAAVPTQSSVIVSTAIGAVTQPGSSTASTPATTTSALSAITNAAVRAAVASNNAQQISMITEAAAAAVTSPQATTGANDNSVAAAVSAITSAAVDAAPSQGAMAAQGAAKGVVEAKIASAVSAAKAANPNASADELTSIANGAANSAGTTLAVSTIATTAAGREIAATAESGNVSLANTTANSIALAVNAGSSAGAATVTNVVTASASITAPTVAVTLSATTGGVLVINSSSGTDQVHSTATQTVSGNQVTVISTATTTPTGQSQTVIANNSILPPLDEIQPVVSPARPL